MIVDITVPPDVNLVKAEGHVKAEKKPNQIGIYLDLAHEVVKCLMWTHHCADSHVSQWFNCQGLRQLDQEHDPESSTP